MLIGRSRKEKGNTDSTEKEGKLLRDVLKSLKMGSTAQVFRQEHRLFIAGFLNLYTNDILVHSVVGDCSVHCRICCSIPGHWPVALPPRCDNQMSSGEQKSVPVENHWYMGKQEGKQTIWV